MSKKSRIIVENRTELSDVTALRLVEVVVNKGRISAEGESYCYFTVFHGDVGVSATRNKRSDRFVVLPVGGSGRNPTAAHVVTTLVVEDDVDG